MPIGKDSIQKRVAKATAEVATAATVETPPEAIEKDVKESAPATVAKKPAATKKSSAKKDGVTI